MEIKQKIKEAIARYGLAVNDMKASIKAVKQIGDQALVNLLEEQLIRYEGVIPELEKTLKSMTGLETAQSKNPTSAKPKDKKAQFVTKINYSGAVRQIAESFGKAPFKIADVFKYLIEKYEIKEQNHKNTVRKRIYSQISTLVKRKAIKGNPETGYVVDKGFERKNSKKPIRRR